MNIFLTEKENLKIRKKIINNVDNLIILLGRSGCDKDEKELQTALQKYNHKKYKKGIKAIKKSIKIIEKKKVNKK